MPSVRACHQDVAGDTGGHAVAGHDSAAVCCRCARSCRKAPGCVLVKNKVGNLAIFDGRTYTGFVNLRNGEGAGR